MPDSVKYSLFRGNTSGINSTTVQDGQIFFDKERHRILMDTYIGNNLHRIVMTESTTFTGTEEEWNALSDEEKAKYTYVYFTGDYVEPNGIMVGATSSVAGTPGLVPRPQIGDNDKFLKGDATWEELSLSNLTDVNPSSQTDGQALIWDNTSNMWVNGDVVSSVDSELSSSSENPVQNKVINTALGNKVNTSDVGSANGIAQLDETGKVPISQLPATMSRLEKYANRTLFPATGDDNTLYVALDTNYTYRWTGADYVQIDESIQLGETATTAYRGDRGKAAYDHATDASRLTTATASGLYKIAATAEGHVAGLTAVTKSDITALGIPSRGGTPATYSSTEPSGAAVGDIWIA